MTEQTAADEVLAHSEDEGEWEDAAVVIERRPTGTQVISARLPVALAQEFLAEAERRGIKPSELMRQLIEQQLSHRPVESVNAFAGQRVRMQHLFLSYATENPSLAPELAPEFVALGVETRAE